MSSQGRAVSASEQEFWDRVFFELLGQHHGLTSCAEGADRALERRRGASLRTVVEVKVEGGERIAELTKILRDAAAAAGAPLKSGGV